MRRLSLKHLLVLLVVVVVLVLALAGPASASSRGFNYEFKQACPCGSVYGFVAGVDSPGYREFVAQGSVSLRCLGSVEKEFAFTEYDQGGSLLYLSKRVDCSLTGTRAEMLLQVITLPGSSRPEISWSWRCGKPTP